MAVNMYQSLLKYKKYRYLKASSILLIVCIVIYLSQGPSQPANGGTTQGYILGSIATFIILLLTYLGIRKRQYSSNLGNLQGWTSAHVYLGISLLLIASLHTDFQVGWNVHTLAYSLMLLVILSGFYGLYTYMHYPRVLSNNNTGGSQDVWLEEMSEIDDKIKEISISCRLNERLYVLSAIKNTSLKGGLFNQFKGKDYSKVREQEGNKKLVSNKNQQTVINILAQAIPKSISQSESSALNQLLTLFSRRQRLLKIIRRNLQIKAYLKMWLIFHIPLTIALLAALFVHILVVFLYW